LAALQRENEQSKARLEQAEMIIDAPKKLSQLLGIAAEQTPIGNAR